MAFPFTPLDVGARLLLGGVWTDVTDDVRGLTADDGRIVITRGTRNEASVAQPTSVKLALDASPPAGSPPGTAGPYEWRNPADPLWGLLKRGTPLQVYRGTPHVGAGTGTSVDATAQVAPSVDAPTAAGMLLSAWMVPDAAATWTLPGSMTSVALASDTRIAMRAAKQLLSSSGATGTRTATCSVSEDYAAVSVFINGPTADPTGSVNSATGSLVVDGTAGDLWVLIAGFSSDPATDPAAVLRPPRQPLDTDDGGRWVTLADTGSVPVGDAQAEHLRMIVWVKTVSTTSATHTITLPPSTTVDEQLMVVKRIPAANVAAWDIRADVRISSLPARQDPSGNSRWIPVEASGVLRQIDRRGAPSRSTIHRAVMAKDQDAYRVSYWPCEDASGATALGSAIPGQPAMVINGQVQAASYDGFAGSESLPTLTTPAGATSGSRVYGRVRPYPQGATFYRGLFAIPSGGLSIGANVVSLYMTGTARRYKVQWSSGGGGSLQLRSFGDDGALLAESSVATFGVTNTQFLLSVELVQDGADVDYVVFVRKTSGGAVDAGNVLSGTLAGQTMGRAWRLQLGGGANGLSFGHQAIGKSQSFLFDIRDALVGYAGETAARRVLRLGTESNVATSIVGDPDDDVPMGPERAGQTLAANLRECAATGGGLLYEPREFYGLAYRTVRSLYGTRDPALALTYGATGEVMSLEPVPDDALTVNDVTVSSVAGGSGRAAQESGPLNIDDPEDDPDGIGSVPGSAQVNAASSLDVLSHANWRRHAGTQGGDRYPSVPLRLQAMAAAGNATLMEQAAALDVGGRVTIDSLPSRLGADDVSQVAVGFSETLSQFEFEVTPNMVPESTYGRVLRYAESGETPDPDDPTRYGPEDSRTNGSFVAGTGTALAVTDQTGGNCLWDTGADDFDVIVSGVRLRVTAVGAAVGANQTLTVQQAPINGVVKTIPSGSRVELWRQGVWGL